jgi:hypothetical protein
MLERAVRQVRIDLRLGDAEIQGVLMRVTDVELIPREDLATVLGGDPGLPFKPCTGNSDGKCGTADIDTRDLSVLVNSDMTHRGQAALNPKYAQYFNKDAIALAHSIWCAPSGACGSNVLP